MEQATNILVVLLVLVTIALILLIVKLNKRYVSHKDNYGKLYDKYSKLNNVLKVLDSKDKAVLVTLLSDSATVHSATMKIHATNRHKEEILYDGTTSEKELTLRNTRNSDLKEGISCFFHTLGKGVFAYALPEIFKTLKSIGFSLVNIDKKYTITNAKSSVRKIYALDESKEVLGINKFNALNHVMPIDGDYMTSPLLVLIDCNLLKESIIDFKENNAFKKIINPYLTREEKKYGKVLKVSTSLKLAKIEYANETKIVKIYSL